MESRNSSAIVKRRWISTLRRKSSAGGFSPGRSVWTGSAVCRGLFFADFVLLDIACGLSVGRDWWSGKSYSAPPPTRASRTVQRLSNAREAGEDLLFCIRNSRPVRYGHEQSIGKVRKRTPGPSGHHSARAADFQRSRRLGGIQKLRPAGA